MSARARLTHTPTGERHGRRPRRRRLVVLLSAAVLAIPAAASAWQEQQRSTIPVTLGDVVKVAGAPVGCVVRRQDGYRALDCRRIGPLAGSYGTILTSRKVLVVRFESQKTAKIVFSAHHKRLRVQTCG